MTLVRRFVDEQPQYGLHAARSVRRALAVGPAALAEDALDPLERPSIVEV
jgi:hypothetical protein